MLINFFFSCDTLMHLHIYEHINIGALARHCMYIYRLALDFFVFVFLYETNVMRTRYSLHVLTLWRSFSSRNSLLNSPFRIYTNRNVINSENFQRDLFAMNEKLLYYINEYFKIKGSQMGVGNVYENKNKDIGKYINNHSVLIKKRIGCLFPPCYSQVLFHCCTLMNDFDYISIPIPIKNWKQIEQKYLFFISENKTDIILCHPFYKHYIEEISFHLQIPFLICYDKPDIVTIEQHVEDCSEGKEIFATKFLYHSSDKLPQEHLNVKLYEKKKGDTVQKEERIKKKKPGETSKKYFDSTTDKIKTNGINKNIEESSIILQLSKENECDRKICFSLSQIWEQSKTLSAMCELNETDTALIGVPPNKIEYFDVMFSLINAKAMIVFPEMNRNKVLQNTNYMSWFTKHMKKKKENNFPVHQIVKQSNNLNVPHDFAFIDGASLFDEINDCQRNISVLILHNYLIRDFLYFWEHCDINKLTKTEFLEKSADKIKKIIINGNEIKPGVNKTYIQKIQNIFKNAKIYQRYILQEIGTICVTPLDNVEHEVDTECQKKTAGYLMPNVTAEIDSETQTLKVKINYDKYNDKDRCTFDNTSDMTNKINDRFDKNGFYKTKYLASIDQNSLLTINGYINEIKKLPEEYNLYYTQRRDKMEKMPPGYLKRVRLHGQIWGNFHANKKNWKRKF